MTDPIYVVEIEASPKAGTEAAETPSGAFINVYVRASRDDAAAEQARAEVEAAGWTVDALKGSTVASAESFDPGSDGLAYYEQCQIDGLVIVIHTWKHQH